MVLNVMFVVVSDEFLVTWDDKLCDSASGREEAFREAGDDDKRTNNPHPDFQRGSDD